MAYIENFKGFPKVYVQPKTPFQKTINTHLLPKLPIDLLKIVLRYSESTDSYFDDIVQCHEKKYCQNVIRAPVEHTICSHCAHKRIKSSKLS